MTEIDYSLLNEEHTNKYRETNGKVGYLWNDAPILLLTYTGRRSGEQRTTPLIFGRDGDDYLIVASMGGMPRHPWWYENLRADPEAEIQVLGDHIPVTARTADAGEKPRLWQIMREIWPSYDEYQSRTEREIPVVVLTPR